MRSVIWDLGGTLVDTYPDVDRALAGAVHQQVDQVALEEVARLTRISSSHAIQTLSERHGVPQRRLRIAYEAVKEHWRVHPAPLQAGAREVMAAVSAAGGLNLVATHRDRESATILLDALGITVDDMVCAPDGYARKPAPDMVLELLDRHDLAAEQCLAVGDRTVDVEAAAAAGVRAALLVTPGIPLASAGAQEIHSLTELLGILQLPGAAQG